MLWLNKDVGNAGPHVQVECNGTNMEGPQCSTFVQDNGIYKGEEAAQLERNDKAKRARAAAAAPEL